MNLYTINNLDYSIKNKLILNNVSFSVKSGEILGILGPNGSGKSTLLKTLLNYLNKDKGKIEVFGKDIEKYKNKELAKITAFVPQKPRLTMSLTTYDFILLGRLPHVKNSFSSYNKKDFNLVNEIMEILKLNEFKNRDVQSLSGGEFQRVLLGRALAQEPKVLILDEATSAMDMNHALHMMNLTEKLVKNHDLTIIAVLHDLNLAALYCDKAIFLKEGKVKYFGKIKELFTKEKLKEIYGFNCHIIENSYGRPSIIPLKGV